MVMQTLKDAISSDSLGSTLVKLNDHFYNRKHEGQIRDAILLNINESERYRSLSEYPRGTSSYPSRLGNFPELKKFTTEIKKKTIGTASIDLTLINRLSGQFAAAIEFKHHFPKDLDRLPDRRAIISDMTRSVGNIKTTHFVLILQDRQIPDHLLVKTKWISGKIEDHLVHESSKDQPLGPIKFRNRNDDISTLEKLESYLSELEKDMKKYDVKINGKTIVPTQAVGNSIRSTYQFVIYEL